MTEPHTPSANVERMIGVIRFMGALLIVLGLSFFLDAGGLAGMIGISDGSTHRFFGGALMIAGVLDFAILPGILRKHVGKKPE